jgi:hypothetical protein
MSKSAGPVPLTQTLFTKEAFSSLSQKLFVPFRGFISSAEHAAEYRRPTSKSPA